LEALRRLEYRGYDSAGIATLVGGTTERRRAEGKVERLAQKLAREPLAGVTGIGHTRWATHGAPCERNAHPISTDRVAVVHNGIIENHRALRAQLEALGERFETETDTEVIAVLLTRMLRAGLDPVGAVKAALSELEGALALAILFVGHEDMMICVRRGSPMAIGHGEDEMSVGSDALALGAFTDRITYLEEGDWAVVSRSGAIIHDASGKRVTRPQRHVAAARNDASKGGYAHYMHKEIFDQPAAVSSTLHAMMDPAARRIDLERAGIDTAGIDTVTIIACGTSFHAGMVARYWLESLAGLPVQCEIASEFRYRQPPLRRGSVVIAISQSGETADTLAAMRYAKSRGARTIAVVNVPESTLAREADAVLPTLAGIEVGVASTKAFTTQLVVLACLAIGLGRATGAIDHAVEQRLISGLAAAPELMNQALSDDGHADAVAALLANARDVLFLGRGTAYPIALEGALKLKEVSYVHAEGLAAGEMKHGPIALIDRAVPVIIVAPPDGLFEKSAANMSEVLARGGQAILISSRRQTERFASSTVAAIALPECEPIAAPLLYAVPMQLLAYHAGLRRGCAVDQPRNLAKSVTVE
jgi:glucosamine--fructose-6-phosphate aminotransferase (isomerizing)